jgi:hypothetical protein
VRSFIPIIAASLLLSTHGFSASVIWAAAEASQLRVSDGAFAPVGNLVRLGYFNVSDELIQQNAANIAFLNENFQEFGNARIGDGTGIAGEFAKTSSQPSSETQFDGKQIYVWGFASGDNTTVERSLATATQHGIFYMTGGSNPNGDLQDPDWLFPNASGIPSGESTIDLADLTFDATRLNSGARVLIGSFGTQEDFMFAVIPEPSSAVLLSIASTALLLKRRRRS